MVHISGHLKTGKCKERVCLNSKMVLYMMVNTKIIGSMGLANICLRMVKFIKENGKMGSGKVMVILQLKMVKRQKVTGNAVKATISDNN